MKNDNLTRPAVCPHCGFVASVANIARWHGDRCLSIDPNGHEGQNSNLNKAAIFISLDTEDIRFFGSLKAATEHFGATNSAMFGQVLLGQRGSYFGVVPMRLNDFIHITEDELTDLLDNARERRLRANADQQPHGTTTSQDQRHKRPVANA